MSLLSVDQALELVLALARPPCPEDVDIQDTLGRVLMLDAVSAITQPPFDSAAMDGYAVREADLSQFPALLRVVGGSYPGSRWDGPVEPGACVRIFTGAPVPRWADRVVIQENVRSSGDAAAIDEHPGTVRYIRKRASDSRNRSS